MRWIPTKEQFSKWSLPAKATYVSAIIAVITVPSLILFYWEFVCAGLSSMKPVRVILESASGSEIRLSVHNPKGRHVVIRGAYLVAVFPPAYNKDFEQLPITAFGPNSQRSPFIIDKNSAAIVTINKESLLPVSDTEGWDLAYHTYYLELFLWSLANNNDAGMFFTCAVYLLVDDQSAIPHDVDADHSRLQVLNCHVLLAITGDFRPYQYGNEKYTKDPPARPGASRRGR